jgi:hypothetical protein
MNISRKRVTLAAFLLGTGLAVPAAESAAERNAGMAGGKALVVALSETHGSGISGTATITPSGRHLWVVLRLSGPVPRNSMAHLHTGPCSREPTFSNPRIASGLKNVVNGRSRTRVLLTTLRQLRARSHSINVHDPKSFDVIACGDIPRSS